MESWSIGEIARKLGVDAPAVGSREIVAKYQVDSRWVEAGSLFFALPGAKVDGHQFLEEVAKKGARGALVRNDYAGPDFGLPLLRVPDVCVALHSLAHQRVQERNVPIIGITGSVGKTTTKEFLARILSERYRVVKSSGNQNSQTGLPLSLLNNTEEADLLVLEMGMNSPSGDLARLVALAPPDVAVLTAISWSHVGFFPDGIAGIAREKAAILNHPKTQEAIVAKSTQRYASICQASVPLQTSCALVPHGGTAADYEGIWTGGKMLRVIEGDHFSPPLSLPFQIRHFVENALIAVTVCRRMGMSWEQIQRATPFLTTAPRRFEEVWHEGVCWINDTYNASFDAMLAALSSLPRPSRPEGRRIAVLGKMPDLGDFSDDCHRQVGRVALEHVDYLIAYGSPTRPMQEMFQSGGKPAEFYEDLEALRQRLQELICSGDVVLVKGANSLAMWDLCPQRGES